MKKRLLPVFLLALYLMSIVNTSLYAQDNVEKLKAELLEKDRKAVELIKKNIPQMLEKGRKYLEKDSIFPLLMQRTSGNIGTPGDILISFKGSSGLRFAGHAAIVGFSSDVTIESFQQNFSPINKDGVQYYTNYWNDEKGGLWLRPKKNGWNIGIGAVNYANSQVGKPYNLNFLDKYRTDRFYCSQLVWHAWMSQGVDCDSNDGDAVLPSDIANSDELYLVKVID